MNNNRYIDYLVKQAAHTVKQGIVQEPRAFYDLLTVNQLTLTEGSPDVFVNGEKYPVIIRRATFALRPDFNSGQGLDERALQAVGARFVFQDQYYQNRDFVAVPLWSNHVAAGPEATSRATSSQIFFRPLILSARDSLRVEVQLEPQPAPIDPREISVSFNGTGLLSQRPYFLSGSVTLDSEQPTIIDPVNYRNDGSEPIALTDWTVHAGAADTSVTGAGDVREVRVGIRQIGGGTREDFFRGPIVPAALVNMPASLAGVTKGRAVVHHFPGDGLYWEPGNGLRVEALALGAAADGLEVGIALHGSIVVP